MRQHSAMHYLLNELPTCGDGAQACGELEAVRALSLFYARGVCNRLIAGV